MYLIGLVIVSLVFYVYLKVQQLKAKGPMEAIWYSSKGSIAIGIFFASAGMSAYLIFQTTVASIIAIIFAFYGLINLILGFRNYRIYLPHARKELEAVSK